MTTWKKRNWTKNNLVSIDHLLCFPLTRTSLSEPALTKEEIKAIVERYENAEGSEDEEYVEVSDHEEKWDCESILSKWELVRRIFFFNFSEK